jgi:hypothetical protein
MRKQEQAIAFPDTEEVTVQIRGRTFARRPDGEGKASEARPGRRAANLGRPCHQRARQAGNCGHQRSTTDTANGFRSGHTQVDPLRETTF